MTIKPKWDSKSAGEYERRMKAEKEDDDDIQDYKKPWVGLTEQEQGAIMEDLNAYGANLYHFAKAIEAKLKEKNT